MLEKKIESADLYKTELGLTVVDNVIHFNNEESLVLTQNYLNGLSEKERIEWEISHNFISNKTRSYEGYDLLLEASDMDQFQKFLLNYSDVLYLQGDEVLQHVDGGALSSVCNSNGNYFIGSIAYKITPEYEYASDQGDLAKLDEAAENSGGSTKGVVAIPRERFGLLKSLSCSSDEWEGNKVYDHPTLTDRQVIVQVTTGFGSELQYGTYYKGWYTQTVKTISRKKNLGIWMKYNTQHYIRDFKVGIKTPDSNNVTFTTVDYYPWYTPTFSLHYQNIPYQYTNDDVKEWTWASNAQVGLDIFYYYPYGASPSVIYPPYIKSINGKVWIRGFESEDNAYVISESGCS